MIVQKNHLLLRFLKVRLVVNGKVIYPVSRNKPIEISIPTNPTKIVATDGFHITKPVEVQCNYRQNNYYQISCGIENDQLIVGAILVLIVFSMGTTSGLWLMQLFAFVPIFYFLFSYYIRRKEFIRIRKV